MTRKIHRAYNCALPPPRPRLEDAPARPEARESVEAFIARGGRVERLPVRRQA